MCTAVCELLGSLLNVATLVGRVILRATVLPSLAAALASPLLMLNWAPSPCTARKVRSSRAATLPRTCRHRLHTAKQLSSSVCEGTKPNTMARISSGTDAIGHQRAAILLDMRMVFGEHVQLF